MRNIQATSIEKRLVHLRSVFYVMLQILTFIEIIFIFPLCFLRFILLSVRFLCLLLVVN